jgi:predicted O-methyltransferase YrrM
MEKKLEILQEIPTGWRDHVTFAQWIVKRKNPEVIVDLGVDYGYSTFCFALPNIGTVYGIDSFEGDSMVGFYNAYEHVKQKKEELELSNLQIIKGYFDDVSKTWNKEIDILHIDGFHTYEAVKNDYDTWSKFVKNDGIILFHDTEVESFGVKQFFNELDLPKTNFTFCHGLGVASLDQNLIEEIKVEFDLL